MSDERLPVDLGAPGTKIVVRGGSFLREKTRRGHSIARRKRPTDIPLDVGFRVVIECPAEAEETP